jgi:hypothetical protein
MDAWWIHLDCDSAVVYRPIFTRSNIFGFVGLKGARGSVVG